MERASGGGVAAEVVRYTRAAGRFDGVGPERRRREEKPERQLHRLRGLRVKATYSLPALAASSEDVALLMGPRKGIPVWGNEQPLDANQWGDRALI